MGGSSEAIMNDGAFCSGGLWTVDSVSYYCSALLYRESGPSNTSTGCLISLYLMSALNVLMLWIKIDVIVVEILNILKSLTFERENAG